MGIGFREGRTFDDADRPDTTPVAVISRPLARRLFGESSPAGRRVRLPGLLSALDEADTRWLQIVGGAEGVRSESLTAGLSLDIYLSNQQQFAGDTFSSSGAGRIPPPSLRLWSKPSRRSIQSRHLGFPHRGPVR
jgi:hypothetical protein